MANPEFAPKRDKMVAAARKWLDADVIESLLELDLDDEDLLMALFAELAEAGLEDPAEFLADIEEA